MMSLRFAEIVFMMFYNDNDNVYIVASNGELIRVSSFTTEFFVNVYKIVQAFLFQVALL